MKILFFQNEYRFLSNFYPCEIKYGDIVFPTLEHAYVAAKTKDIDIRKEISQFSSCTAGRAKRFGRTLQMRNNWDFIKIEIMRKLLKRKFSNPNLTRLLLNTGNKILIEGNFWHDNFWGECYCPKCKYRRKENRLGKLLMKVRRELQEKENG